MVGACATLHGSGRLGYACPRYGGTQCFTTRPSTTTSCSKWRGHVHLDCLKRRWLRRKKWEDGHVVLSPVVAAQGQPTETAQARTQVASGRTPMDLPSVGSTQFLVPPHRICHRVTGACDAQGFSLLDTCLCLLLILQASLGRYVSNSKGPSNYVGLRVRDRLASPQIAGEVFLGPSPFSSSPCTGYFSLRSRAHRSTSSEHFVHWTDCVCSGGLLRVGGLRSLQSLA